MTLTLRAVEVELGGRPVVCGVDLDIGAGETVAVLGPSGAGKTTLLRAVAGLTPIAAGAMQLDGQDLAAVPTHRRNFGLMFQDHALFPHRDVAGNVAYGLERQGVDRAARRSRVGELLDAVGLDGYQSRRIDTLSGGEQQRVALARALAPRPRLMLFDEPFGALDRLRREQLVADVRALLARTGVPALVVTHDHDEAFALASSVAVLRAGRIVQQSSPADLWRAPADEWTARFVGHGDAVDGIVGGASLLDGHRDVATPWGDVPVPSGAAPGAVRVVLRSDALSIARPDAHARRDSMPTLVGTILDATFRGGRTVARVRLGSGPPVAVVTDDAVTPGETVQLGCDPDAVLLYRSGAPQPASTSLDAEPVAGDENAQ